MPTNKYEMIVIFDPTQEEDVIEGKIQRIREELDTSGGDIEDVAPWGRRRLAYPIQKRSEGYYCLFRFEVDRGAIRELEHKLRLDETVMRHLVLVRDPRDDSTIEEPERPRRGRGERSEDGPAPVSGPDGGKAPAEATPAADAAAETTEDAPAEEAAEAEAPAEDAPAEEAAEAEAPAEDAPAEEAAEAEAPAEDAPAEEAAEAEAPAEDAPAESEADASDETEADSEEETVSATPSE